MTKDQLIIILLYKKIKMTTNSRTWSSLLRAVYVLYSIGKHLVIYLWSAISDWAWYRKPLISGWRERSPTLFGIVNELFSEIQYPTPCLPNRSVQWLLGNMLACEPKGHGFNVSGYVNKCFDIGMDSDADIEMTVFSPTYFLLISE
jgi:hypothetical protein